MKKYMIAVAAILLFAGTSNAQVARKQATKTSVAKQPAAIDKASTANNKAAAATANVTPAVKKTATEKATIKRKHYHKKTKMAAKAGAK